MDPVDVLKELVKIDTRNPPGNTVRAVEFLEDLFSSYNTRVVGDGEKLNLIVKISKGKPEFLFTSHLDTVPADDSMLVPKLAEGRLYGRGSCDAKGCVAAIVSAFHGLEIDGKGVTLAFTADEEVGGQKGLGLVMEQISPDYVVIGEPFGSDRIGVAQASVVLLKLIVHGKGGHTATADVKEGAVYRASRFVIDAVERFSGVKGNREDYFRKISKLGLDVEYRGNGDVVFNPSIIRAGIKRNIVPDVCEIEVDMRVAPWVDMKDVRSALKYEGVDVFIVGYLKPFGFGLDDVPEERDVELLGIIRKAVEKEGMTPRAVVSLGVGDARHVRNRGIPAFYYGPGGENMHSRDEFVYLSELEKAVKVYRRMVTL
ncbi:M20 family metallopeptidase [Geoglobus ahangari]